MKENLIKMLWLPGHGELSNFIKNCEKDFLIPLSIEYPDRTHFNILINDNVDKLKDLNRVLKMIKSLSLDTDFKDFLKTFSLNLNTKSDEFCPALV